MTEIRAVFEALLTRFSARFETTALVINVGAGRHAYREWFDCRVVTADPLPGCDEQWAAEAIPHPDGSVDGLLCVGVFDRLDDPMQAIREFRRVLRPGGLLFLGFPDRGFEWQKAADRWRLTPSGAAYLVRDFTVLERQPVEPLFHFLVVQKPDA